MTHYLLVPSWDYILLRNKIWTPRVLFHLSRWRSREPTNPASLNHSTTLLWFSNFANLEFFFSISYCIYHWKKYCVKWNNFRYHYRRIIKSWLVRQTSRLINAGSKGKEIVTVQRRNKWRAFNWEILSYSAISTNERNVWAEIREDVSWLRIEVILEK